jgi:hypothetical protein
MKTKINQLTNAAMLAALLLAWPGALKAQGSLLFSQYTSTTVARTADFTDVTSGSILGTRVVDYSNLVAGQVFRFRAMGHVTTANISPSACLLFLPAQQQLCNPGYFALPAGMKEAAIVVEVDVTLTSFDQVLNLFTASANMRVTVDGQLVQTRPFTGDAIQLGAWRPLITNVGLAWGWNSPSSGSVTFTTLTCEWLR